MNLSTLCYIENQDAYLMLHRIKKQNDINEGKWIGVGGHFEEGESPEECLVREVKEETGFTLLNYRFRGLVTFISDKGVTEYMCLYTSDAFEGEMVSCDEGELCWVKKDKILELNLWEGDKIFLNLIRQNAPFFSLKLRYQGEQLIEIMLNGQKISADAGGNNR